MKHDFDECAKNYGIYKTDNGIEIAATGWACVQGDGHSYEAVAVDRKDNEYLILWDVSDEWKKAQEARDYATVKRCGGNLEEKEFVFFDPKTDDPNDYIGYLDDESNACEWDTYTVQTL